MASREMLLKKNIMTKEKMGPMAKAAKFGADITVPIMALEPPEKIVDKYITSKNQDSKMK